ncbi:hypothetical protein NP493_1200g00031 [Ridgeia piscesae]|uniref:Uncharacterized protein n=1 Tax=Ridgeia piscesae TaxID=27915 RepID=A0AAD9KCL8_RIDPI|nr:hypothetical protein NP493_1200g00031 [Ridgeia piscesae]
MYVKIVDADPNPEHYKPPEELFVERVMVRFEKRRGMWIIVTDIGIYIMFTFLLLMMSLIQRHPHTFDLTEALHDLRRGGWIDEYTAVVLVEFTVYNHPFHLISVVVLAFEFLRGGAIQPYVRIFTVMPYHWQWGVRAILITTCQVLYMLCNIWKTKNTWRTLWARKGDRAYWTNVWTYIDWMHVFVSYISGAVECIRFSETKAIISDVLQAPEVFHSFYGVVQLDFLATYLMSILLTLSFLHVLKLLNFNKHVLLVTVTLNRSVKPLLNYVLFMIISCTLFLGIAILVLGPWCEDYSTATSAMANLFGLMFVFVCYQVARVTGPLFFVVVGSTFLMLWIPLIRASQFDQIDFLQLKLKRFVGIVGSAEYERRLHETEEKELSRRIQENTCRLRETEELLNYAARNLDTCQPLSRRAARMSSLRERRGGRSANVRDSVRTRGVSGNMSRSEIANEENTGKRQSLRCRRRLRDAGVNRGYPANEICVVAKLYEMTTVSILCCPVYKIWDVVKPCTVVYETTTDESRRCPICQIWHIVKVCVVVYEMSTLPDLRYPICKTCVVVNHCFSVYEMVNLAKHCYPIYDSEGAGRPCVTVYESMNAISHMLHPGEEDLRKEIDTSTIADVQYMAIACE